MINIEVPTRHLRHEEDGLSAKEWVASHHVRGLSTFLYHKIVLPTAEFSCLHQQTASGTRYIPDYLLQALLSLDPSLYCPQDLSTQYSRIKSPDARTRFRYALQPVCHCSSHLSHPHIHARPHTHITLRAQRTMHGIRRQPRGMHLDQRLHQRWR